MGGNLLSNILSQGNVSNGTEIMNPRGGTVGTGGFFNNQKPMDQYFDQSGPGGFVPNLNISRFTKKENTVHKTNQRVVESIIPKIWRPPKNYHLNIQSGDLIWIDSSDKISERQSQSPQRTVLNFQQLNFELADGKRDAQKILNQFAKEKKISGKKIEIDYDKLILASRISIHGNLQENRSLRTDYEKVVRIHQKDHDEFLKRLKQANNLGNDVLTQLSDDIFLKFDREDKREYLDLFDLYHDFFVYLHSSLIVQKWKFAGVLTDEMKPTRIQRSHYSRQAVSTIVVRGVADDVKNVFGKVLIPGSKNNGGYQRFRSRVRNKKYHALPRYISKQHNLFISLVQLKDKNSKPQRLTYDDVQFTPIWAAPFSVLDKEELDGILHSKYQIQEFGQYIPTSGPCSWNIGRIQAIGEERKQKNTFPTAWGITEKLTGLYDVNKEEVYKRRTNARNLKINIKTK